MSSVVDVRYAPGAADPSLEAAIAALQGAAGDAADIGFEERIDAIHALAGAILSADSELRRRVPADGLAYLATFLQKSYLTGLIRRELGSTESLAGFVRTEGRKSVRYVPRGLVSHWIAGNVPLLALFSWAFSVVLGNRNLIRLSSRQQDVVTPFLDSLASQSDVGRSLARETAVVSFPSSLTDGHRAMSAVADARIAWGGEEAVSAVRSLPAPWHCEDIIFGPRASLAVVDPAAMDDKAIGRLALDTAIFDQMACSSPQCIFVLGDAGSEAFGSFRDRFSAAFAKTARQYPRHTLDFSETYTIGLDRARLLLEGAALWHDDATAWTVAVVTEPNDTVQCANRFVQLIPVASIDDVYRWIPLNVQTVVTQLCGTDFAEFTEQAAYRGVCRFPKPGEGNNFENPWDGVGLVSRLSRMVVRTEPE